jgi:hypothetical protein
VEDHQNLTRERNAFEGIRSLAPVQYRRKSFRCGHGAIVAQGRSVPRTNTTQKDVI